MTDKLILFENSYVTRKEADNYLKGSRRAADLWAAIETVDRRRALISAFREVERFIFEGTQTDVEYADTAVVVVGGTLYAVGDIVSIIGGTGQAAQFKVLAQSGGVVSTVGIVKEERGGYTTTPTNPASTVKVTGSGDDALTLTVTYKTQVASFPRTGLTDKYGLALSEFVAPADVESAQIELAFEISQDTSVEGGANTASNQKRLRAGTAEIEFFRPTDGTPLPSVAWDLLKPFIDSVAGSAGSVSFGTGCSSQFDDADTYTRTQGFQ